MKNTIKSTLVHTFKGITYPLLSDNYFNLFLIMLISFILTPKFLEPLWFIFSVLGTLVTITMEKNNTKFDDTTLKYYDKKGIGRYFKLSLIWSLIIGLFTNIDFESGSVISSFLIYNFLGIFILYSFSYLSDSEISTKYIDNLKEKWLLFSVINMLFVIFSSCIYTPLLIYTYIFTLYSMTFEEIKKEE